MRVLFTTYPERTHFLLMVPLAWALRTAGHEVRVACQPKFADTVTQAGLTAVPVGSNRDLWQVFGRIKEPGTTLVPGLPEPYDSVERDPADITPEYLRAGYARQVSNWHKMMNVPLIKGLVEYAEHWKPDLVVWEPLTYAGAIAAQAVGATQARLLIGADVHGVTRQHFLRVTGGNTGAGGSVPDPESDPMGAWLGGYARAYGGDFTEELITGDFSIDVLPPALQTHAPGLEYLSTRFVPYGGPASVPRWLWEKPARSARRRVALTLGLTVSDHEIGYPIGVQDVLDAVADLDLELVATISAPVRERLSRIPENAKLVDYVPMQALLPTCDAVVHHAGVGTLSTAALYAVPQVTLPWDVDQPILARQLATYGAGLTTHATEATGPVVREHLLRLLDDDAFGRRARQLRAEMLDVPSPAALAADLTDRVRRKKAKPVTG